MTTVYLGLGSNVGNRSRNLSAARRRLREKGVAIKRQSSVIETEPWGVPDQPQFLNQVVQAEWSGTPLQLLRAAKQVEREGGRVSSTSTSCSLVISASSQTGSSSLIRACERESS